MAAHPCRVFPLRWSFICGFSRLFSALQEANCLWMVQFVIQPVDAKAQHPLLTNTHTHTHTHFPTNSVPCSNAALYMIPYLWIKDSIGNIKHILSWQVKMINYMLNLKINKIVIAPEAHSLRIKYPQQCPTSSIHTILLTRTYKCSLGIDKPSSQTLNHNH